jgi:DNA-binding transcriptional MocR family regulator
MRRSGWFPVPRRLLVCPDQIGANDIAVYVAISSFANRDGVAWPATRTIAKRGRVSRSTVRRARGRLVAAGLLTFEPRRSPDGDATSHLYRLPDLTTRDRGNSREDVGQTGADSGSDTRGGVGQSRATNENQGNETKRTISARQTLSTGRIGSKLRDVADRQKQNPRQEKGRA